MNIEMRSVPPREWLAVALPLVFGVILLVAGAAAAAAADTWAVYALAAGVGAMLPLAYTVQLARRHRLFLRTDAAMARSGRITALMPVGWVLGAAALVVRGTVGGSVNTVLYAALGGASLGIWPGLLSNFVRLWREEWAPTSSQSR